MYRQTLGVVTDIEHIEIPSTPKTNWLMLGALGLVALLFFTRGGTKVVVVKK